MLEMIVTALVLGLVIMGALHLLGSTGGASLVNLLLSALVLGVIIIAIMHLLRTL